MRGTAWAFAVCFAAITVCELEIPLRLPIVFSGVITVCLIAAAWLFSAGDLKLSVRRMLQGDCGTATQLSVDSASLPKPW